MSDLEQMLVQTFERRASAAPTSMSTAEVRGAIRRKRNRTLRVGAALAVTLLAAGGALMSAIGPSQHRSSGTGGQPGWSGQVGSFTPIVQLPATGPALVTVARIVQKKPISTYYELCSGNECDADVDVARKTISEQGKGGAVFGLAPQGTAKVLVSVGGGPYLVADVAEIPTATHPLLYAAPAANRSVGSNPAATRTVRAVAIDHSGAVTSAVEVLGSQELAKRHPVLGPTLSLPAAAQDDIGRLAWMSADGWSCEGNRVAVGGSTIFAASQCQKPRKATSVTLVTTGQVLGAPGSGTTLSWQVFRGPSTIRNLVWQPSGGVPRAAAIRATTDGVLAVLVVTGSDASRPDATVTATDASGAVVVSARERQLMDNSADAMSTQVSGHAVPIHVVAP